MNFLNHHDLIIVGGGAAGIFAAIKAKETNPKSSIVILEKTSSVLAKVKISGGGRCNVTHSCFDPKLLAQNYPRGSKELLGPFYKFQPKDTIEWFASRGVKLKTEADSRIFPTTDRSETIIDAFLVNVKKLGIEIFLSQEIINITKENDLFKIELASNTILHANNLLLATGSSNQGYIWAKQLGHTIEKPVPSLFAFNSLSSNLKDLSGVALDNVEIKIKNSPFASKGALLITHLGFSGPAILKLSAWSARYLYENEYRFKLIINWLPDLSQEEIYKKLEALKKTSGQKHLVSENIFNELPNSLWNHFLHTFKEIIKNKILDIPNKNLMQLSLKLHADEYLIEGKTPNKQEFVTCGGINLKEVNFKTMQSKICPSLFFAGEILDVDGLTGGFNFQNAWTTGFIVGSNIF